MGDIIRGLSEAHGMPRALWSISLERGAQKQKLHAQCMMGTHQYSRAQDVGRELRQRLNATFGTHTTAAGTVLGKYTVSIGCLKGNAVHGDVLTAMGYTFKDAKLPHYVNMCSELITADLKEVAIKRYLLYAKLSNKGVKFFDNVNVYDSVTAFCRIRGTDNALNDDGSVRLQSMMIMMLRTGGFNIGKTFVTGQYGFVDVERSSALLRIQMDPVNARLQDFQLVVFGMKADDWKGPLGGHMWRDLDATAVPPPSGAQARAALLRASAQEDGWENSDFLADAEAPRPRADTVAINLAFVEKQRQLRLNQRERPIIKVYEGASGVGKTRGASAMHPEALHWQPTYGTEKPWWSNPLPPSRGTSCFIDEPLDNTDPSKLVPRLMFPHAKHVFGGGACLLETKFVGEHVLFMCTTIITTCTRRIEEWYTTPAGDVQPEWLRRLNDFAIVYDVQPGDLQADDTLTTVGVPFRELCAARMAEFAERRRAAAAVAPAFARDYNAM